MATPKSVAFYTLGCKLNYSETSSIQRLFEDKGFSVHDFEEGADVYVINTCSVTDFADQKCRQIVRRALRQTPQSNVVVVGCYAQLKPQEIADIEGVDLVLGAGEKFRITDYIDTLTKAEGKGLVAAGDIREVNTFQNAFSFGDRTRSFLKVQDGCDYKCSFCTIPLARGKSRSDTVENVLINARKIADMGVKEIVLTGINIGDFGNGTAVIEGVRPKKEAMFIDLIRELDKVEGIERFRISSIEPNLLTDEIIAFVARSQRFAPHFHIPLQSGNNKQLQEMRRRYRRDLYASRVEKIKSVMPHACIGVDVIVGFPNESDADFLETYQFLVDLDISYLHVFTYSERANTPAAEMENPVPMHKRRERNEMLRILSEKKRRAFYQQFMGEKRPVLFEKSKRTGFLTGFTDNYIKIEMPMPYSADVQITEVLHQEKLFVSQNTIHETPLDGERGLVNQIRDIELMDFNEEGDVIAYLPPNLFHRETLRRSVQNLEMSLDT
jgi:threonylcarbamoyladenosine tRNA methylthiotransferase MtaB